MNFKRFVLSSFLLLTATTSYLTAEAQQDASSNKWRLSAALGFGSSEAVNSGIASSLSLGYRFDPALELGIAVDGTFSQSFGTVNVFANQKPALTTLAISQDADNMNSEYQGGSNQFYALTFGVSPIKLFAPDSRHDLFVSVLGGLAYSSMIDILQVPEGTQVINKMKGGFGYGARLSYEYAINDKLGLGALSSYEFSKQSFMAAATLTVHF